MSATEEVSDALLCPFHLHPTTSRSCAGERACQFRFLSHKAGTSPSNRRRRISAKGRNPRILRILNIHSYPGLFGLKHPARLRSHLTSEPIRRRNLAFDREQPL